MESLQEYTPVSEVDTDEEVTSDYTENMSDMGKNKSKGKAKVVKRKSLTNPTSSAKKMKQQKNTSYLDKIGEIIEAENVYEESSNSMTVKQDKHNYTFKYPITNGEDYWILQHYKMQDIKNVTPAERWKHSMCSIRMHTSKKILKDVIIVNQLNKLIESITGRFADDSKKQITKRKTDNN